jgi:hypothetical protein
MDITNEEFIVTYLGVIPNNSDNSEAEIIVSASDVPNAADWRTQGAVSGVKN